MADSIDRDSADYRAGYCEGLAALMARLSAESKRAKRLDRKGIELAWRMAHETREAMLRRPEAKVEEPA